MGAALTFGSIPLSLCQRCPQTWGNTQQRNLLLLSMLGTRTLGGDTIFSVPSEPPKERH